MATGTVKFFNTAKGYGFIQPDAGGDDIFFHITAVERAGLQPPKEGAKLSYDLEEDPKRGKVYAANLAEV